MKRIGLIAAAIVAAGLVFTGCPQNPDNGGNSGIDYNASGNGILPSFGSGKIIRNKVVNLNGSSDVYYEYLEFTSETGGNYSVYKDESVTKTKVDKITLSSGEATLPSTFTYDAASGKFTGGGNTSSSYMFSAEKDGAEKYFVASDVLSTEGENKSSLMNKWTSAKHSNSYTFTASGTVSCDKGSFFYTNANGWILISDDVPFYWAKVGDGNVLYYYVYETERTEVEAAGRAADSRTISLTSSIFLLLNQ